MYGLSIEIDPIIETAPYNPVRLMVQHIKHFEIFEPNTGTF